MEWHYMHQALRGVARRQDEMWSTARRDWTASPSRRGGLRYRLGGALIKAGSALRGGMPAADGPRDVVRYPA